MTESLWIGLGSALWLGLLTSVSPCPMATNVAAMTFVGSRVGSPSRSLMAGLLYTAGRLVAYIGLAMLVVASMLSIPDLAFFLQNNMNKFLGPIMLLVGLFLLGLFRFKAAGLSFGSKLQSRVEKLGIWGAGLLGLLFALSFCPVSAALFFGSLIPLALEHESSVLLPTAYGLGTAAPVVLFAAAIAYGAKWVGSMFNRMTQFEIWARRVTGLIFVGVGVYYILVYIFRVQI